MPKQPVVKIHLGIRPLIYASVVAEAEATGFTVTEIINRALYDAGHGRAAAKAAMTAATKELEGSDDPLVILANTPFPPEPPPAPGYLWAPLEQRQEYWAAIHDIYQARRQLGIKVSDVDYKRYTALERRVKSGQWLS